MKTTMKKIYQAPVAASIELVADEFVAASRLDGVNYDSTGAIDNEGDLLSNKHGWDSANWSSEED